MPRARLVTISVNEHPDESTKNKSEADRFDQSGDRKRAGGKVAADFAVQRRLELLLAPLFKRSLQQPLAGLEFPGVEAVYGLAHKRGRGGITQFGQIV